MSRYVRIFQNLLLFFDSYSAAVASNILARPPPLPVTLPEPVPDVDGSTSFVVGGRCMDYSASASSTIARPAPASTLPASWEGGRRATPARF